MLCRVSNALNSYFGLLAMKELNVSMQASDKLIFIGNQSFLLVSHNHDGSLACCIG